MESVASQSSQLIKGSTEDGVTQEMLASQPEVIWLWYQAAALASPEPLEHCPGHFPLWSACSHRFPQLQKNI